MGLVTAFCPVTVIQTGAARFVADCRAKPIKLAGHVKITLVPERRMASCGTPTVSGTPERRNTTPVFMLSPWLVVPYRVVPDKTNSAMDSAPARPLAKL